jgi:hypothetical protein
VSTSHSLISARHAERRFLAQAFARHIEITRFEDLERQEAAGK